MVNRNSFTPFGLLSYLVLLYFKFSSQASWLCLCVLWEIRRSLKQWNNRRPETFFRNVNSDLLISYFMWFQAFQVLSVDLHAATSSKTSSRHIFLDSVGFLADWLVSIVILSQSVRVFWRDAAVKEHHTDSRMWTTCVYLCVDHKGEQDQWSRSCCHPGLGPVPVWQHGWHPWCCAFTPKADFGFLFGSCFSTLFHLPRPLTHPWFIPPTPAPLLAQARSRSTKNDVEKELPLSFSLESCYPNLI